MLGLFVTLLVGAGALGLGRLFVGARLQRFHALAVLGTSGLIGLGVLGMLTLALGLLPGGFRWGIGVIGLAVLGGLLNLRWLPRFRAPVSAEWLAVLACVAVGLVAVVGILAPSTMSDWDTIAYHLAVPKIWLSAGQITPISFIHHSNFPAVVDSLYVWGLTYGGQSGAKAFQLVYLIFGCLAIAGFGKSRYGTSAGIWAAVAFATVPVVAWEAGTGYIDAAHGLFAGLGAWLIFESWSQDEARSETVVGAMLLAFAAGSKYTGLQTMIAVGVTLVVLAIIQKRGPRLTAFVHAMLVAVALAAPWYLKNIAYTGNPVYPFFYERFGGKNWNQKQADIYRFEQKTFGVPNDGPLSIPAGILGLSYSPGRYVNPNQRLYLDDAQKPAGSGGSPLGATGAVLMVGLVASLIYRRKLADPSTVELGATIWLIISFLMWAVLSQQSRYATTFAVPICLMTGGLIARLSWGRVLAGLVVVQSLWTLYLEKLILLEPDRVQVAFGAVAPADYLKKNLPFYEAATYINANRPKDRVALYDEVFGYYLDAPYFWAGYGHTSELGYESMRTHDDLMAAFKKQDIKLVYVNIAIADREFVRRWVGAMGLEGPAVPLPETEAQALKDDVEARWKPLLAEAVAAGQLRPVQAFRGGLLFEVAP